MNTAYRTGASALSYRGRSEMAHCHIAEHHESGMMFSIQVDAAES